MKDTTIASAAVVFADRVYMSDSALAKLAGLGGYAFADAKDTSDLAAKVGDSQAVKVVVSEYIPVNDVVLSRAPGLKGVIAYGAGYDHLDVSAMKRGGIYACNCRGENAEAVAELVFGLALSLLRKINKAEEWVRTGQWAKTGMALPEWACGNELWRKTIGIIGMGQIGARVSRIARGFDMTILGYDPFINPELYNCLKVEQVSVAQLLSRSDFVSLHLPLTSKTEKLIDATALAKAKPGMILINTSRGKVIDEEALVDALRNGHIKGAALDVFAGEPLQVDHPFTKMENVVLSPHLGALTREAGDRLSDSVVRQVRNIMEGQSPEGLIA